MGGKTGIGWPDETWDPAAEGDLDVPRRWRKPRMILVSDPFREDCADEHIARVWQVMATTPQHTYLIITRQHTRMRDWVIRCKESPAGWITHDGTDPAGAFRGTGVIVGYHSIAPRPEYHRRGPLAGQRKPDPRPTVAYGWPLPNVWLCVSAEDWHWAGIRIPALLDTPAAVRGVSLEPLLGPIDLHDCGGVDTIERDWIGGPGGGMGAPHPLLDWVIVGGESGPGARPMDVAWARRIVADCTEAGVPVFVKQLGAVAGQAIGAGRKGGDWERWPADLQVRQFPVAAAGVAK
jgi:protein gp37